MRNCDGSSVFCLPDPDPFVGKVVWFGIIPAEKELKTTQVSDQSLALGQNARFQK